MEGAGSRRTANVEGAKRVCSGTGLFGRRTLRVQGKEGSVRESATGTRVGGLLERAGSDWLAVSSARSEGGGRDYGVWPVHPATGSGGGARIRPRARLVGIRIELQHRTDTALHPDRLRIH